MPTQKQRDAAEALIKSENVGKPLGTIMREVGYADNTADNPDHLTDSQGWQELMEEYYPDRKVEAVLAEALDANRTISAMTGSKATGQTVDFIDVPDWSTRIDAVKEIHKVKGKYPAEKHAYQLDGKLEVVTHVPDANQNRTDIPATAETT